MVGTGQDAVRTIFSATLPGSICGKPLLPCVPITIISACMCSVPLFSRSPVCRANVFLQEKTWSLAGKVTILPRIALVLVTRQDGSLYARKRLNRSMGTGRTMVELLSADTSTRLCRNLRCIAAGCFAMTSAASASFCEA